MKTTRQVAISLVLLSAAVQAQTTPSPVKPASAVAPPRQLPDVPAPMFQGATTNSGFVAAHEKFVKTAKQGKAQLLFLGDSITWAWLNQKELWTKTFGAYLPANFGHPGDRTQHVLWRIQNGELEGIKPKAVVLMIGTNNFSGPDTPADIARGITAIVNTIRTKQPQAKILLLGIFPRGEKPSKLRDKVAEANAIIAKLEDKKHIFYLDIGDKFIQPDGTISREIMPDFLHLSPAGYEIWGKAIAPKVAELMR